MDPGVSAALKDVLRRTLEDLGNDEFKKFKHYLRDTNKQDEAKIPWNKLQDADSLSTVELIVGVYSSDSGDVVVSILQKISKIDLAKALQRDLEGVLKGQRRKAMPPLMAREEGNAATDDCCMDLK